MLRNAPNFIMKKITKKDKMSATSVKPIKISDNEYKRLQKFGFAGESINDALKRVLDIAEKNRKDALPKE
jgi:hypothetical protein